MPTDFNDRQKENIGGSLLNISKQSKHALAYYAVAFAARKPMLPSRYAGNTTSESVNNCICSKVIRNENKKILEWTYLRRRIGNRLKLYYLLHYTPLTWTDCQLKKTRWRIHSTELKRSWLSYEISECVYRFFCVQFSFCNVYENESKAECLWYGTFFLGTTASIGLIEIEVWHSLPIPL